MERKKIIIISIICVVLIFFFAPLIPQKGMTCMYPGNPELGQPGCPPPRTYLITAANFFGISPFQWIY